MVRNICCSKYSLNRGSWTREEDEILAAYIEVNGPGKWPRLPKEAGLNRCGKSCRLRWMNYLRPDIRRGNIEPEEEDLIIRLHKLLGNRWSLIAGRLPGRTDNEVKNYWNTHLKRKVQQDQTRDEMHAIQQTPQTDAKLVKTKARRCTAGVLIDPKVDGGTGIGLNRMMIREECNQRDSFPSLEQGILFNEMTENWVATDWEFGSLAWFMD